MKVNRKSVAVAATAGALAAGGVAVAGAIGGSSESEESVAGADAEGAETAALEAVGGGHVTEVEHQDDPGSGAFEVEVQRPNGSQVEVHLDRDYEVVGTESDDDAEDEGGGSAEDDDTGERGEHEGAGD